MLFISTLKDMWLYLYRNLKLIGKIILFPFMLFVTLCFIIFAFIEFFILDVWLFLIELLSKDGDVKSLIYSIF